MSAYVRDTAAEMSKLYGIPTSVNRLGHIVIRESDFAWLTQATKWSIHFNPPTGLWAVPIETAPDWTFDPLTVAWLRLVARFIVSLRLRQITNSLTSILTPKETR